MIWKPNVTVAAIIEQNGKFLLVEEMPDGVNLRLNQPAGHLEAGETLYHACCREVLEETGYTFLPVALTGIYHWRAKQNGTTYLRFTYTGNVTGHDPERTLDRGIVRATWFTIDDIRAKQSMHRSPMVLQSIEDYLAGKRYPLDLLTNGAL
ncbi:MAG: NUDIX hydrolase [Nitrosomonas sp.]|nr:NUDIX hydrolase [Nitrosomonas sp.]